MKLKIDPSSISCNFFLKNFYISNEKKIKVKFLREIGVHYNRGLRQLPF